jgi:hypothetical protein
MTGWPQAETQARLANGLIRADGLMGSPRARNCHLAGREIVAPISARVSLGRSGYRNGSTRMALVACDDRAAHGCAALSPRATEASAPRRLLASSLPGLQRLMRVVLVSPLRQLPLMRWKVAQRRIRLGW